ncbi:MAG TPA: response regulator transcription factor [bacterium]|nr:response regulator transcription factor [bacterium]
MRTVLVVDDEPRIVKIARDYLERGGFRVITAADGPSVLPAVRTEKPDLLVLDLALPGQDGLDVMRSLRRESDVPVIMLTARADEADRLIGLELGADDYIVKPFSPKELVARVRAVLRRWDGARTGAAPIRAGDLVLDVAKMEVRLGARPLALTPTEFQLLAHLARQPGRVFTRGQLLEAVRGMAIESYERAIDSHVKNIRRKIEPDPHHPRYILTVAGIGYKFADV